jgi:dihydrolipoamide dehydrogenase
MKYDVAIIGGGPGGYVAAIRAGQTGLKTVLVEKDNIGGMCLNWGCIPTKALLESAKRFTDALDGDKFGIGGIDKKKLFFDLAGALKRAERITKKLTKGVEFLLTKNGVEIVKDTAMIESATSISTGKGGIEASYIIIATGSRPNPLPDSIPADKQLEIYDLLRLSELPKSIVVYGQGPNAVELSQFFAMAGSKIFLAVPSDDLLPSADQFFAESAIKHLKKDGAAVYLNASISGYEDGFVVLGENKIQAEYVLNANLRSAVIPESKVSLVKENGFLFVDEYLRTSAQTIFAVGDVNGKSSLAHSASAQGLHAVDFINGIKEPMDHLKYPLNIYTYPEMAQIGLTEEQLKERGSEFKISEFPLSANGKAMIEDEIDGRIRILFEPKYGEVLGVQIIAPHATDMIAEAAVLMSIEGTVFDLAKVIHAHPTVSEVFLEAGMGAVDKPIHI